jgi:TolB protein
MIQLFSNALLAYAMFLFDLIAVKPASAQNAVGIFESYGNVGTGVKPGSATYIPETGQYVISGAGYNIWGDHDEFQYVWKKMKGDFILYTRADFLGAWVNYHRKVAWMAIPPMLTRLNMAMASHPCSSAVLPAPKPKSIK